MDMRQVRMGLGPQSEGVHELLPRQARGDPGDEENEEGLVESNDPEGAGENYASMGSAEAAGGFTGTGTSGANTSSVAAGGKMEDQRCAIAARIAAEWDDAGARRDYRLRIKRGPISSRRRSHGCRALWRV